VRMYWPICLAWHTQKPIGIAECPNRVIVKSKPSSRLLR